MKSIKASDLSKRQVFKSTSQAGKGPDPRRVEADKWYDAPLWENFGPDAHKDKHECCTTSIEDMI